MLGDGVRYYPVHLFNAKAQRRKVAKDVTAVSRWDEDCELPWRLVPLMIVVSVDDALGNVSNVSNVNVCVS